MKEPLFFAPVFQEKIWGGQQLAQQFQLTLPAERIGEAWCLSAHPHGESVCTAPAVARGKSLADIYQEYPEWFGMPTQEQFPLLVKLLDASDKLSVQVHPDDSYALAHEGELGKNECWYIVAAQEGAEIILGHHATTSAAFDDLVAAGDWDKLLRRVPVRSGDFFDVPSGTIHAIGAGIVILETQQSSDTTYRVFDYDRLGDDGLPRPLHLQQVREVTQIPHQDATVPPLPVVHAGGVETQLVNNHYFAVSKWESRESLALQLAGPYTLVTAIAGVGQLHVDDCVYPLHAGTSFILPHAVRAVRLSGEITCIASYPTSEMEVGKVS